MLTNYSRVEIKFYIHGFPYASQILLWKYLKKKIIDDKTEAASHIFWATHQGTVHLDSFHRELIIVGILFLLPHMATIFILLLVAECQIKIANNKLREVLGGTDFKRERMKRERKTVSWPLSIGHWWEKCRREVDILHLYYQNRAPYSRKVFWLTALRSSLTAAVLKVWSLGRQISITGELVQNANSQAPPQIKKSKTLGQGPSKMCFDKHLVMSSLFF